MKGECPWSGHGTQAKIWDGCSISVEFAAAVQSLHIGKPTLSDIV